MANTLWQCLLDEMNRTAVDDTWTPTNIWDALTECVEAANERSRPRRPQSTRGPQ